VSVEMGRVVIISLVSCSIKQSERKGDLVHGNSVG
jgi:hypothetical protein